MEHQDWNTVVIQKKKPKKIVQKTEKKITENRDVQIQNKKFGQILLQCRTAKKETQETLSNKLGINKNILKNWENNNEIPSNAEIAKIEKILNVKLPRNKKTIIEF